MQNLSHSSSSPVSARGEHLHDLWFRRSHPYVPTTTASFKPVNSYQCAGKNSWLPVNWVAWGRNFIAFFIITAANHHHSTWVHDPSHSCWRQKWRPVAADVLKSCLKSVWTLKLLIYVNTTRNFFPDLCWLLSWKHGHKGSRLSGEHISGISFSLRCTWNFCR